MKLPLATTRGAIRREPAATAEVREIVRQLRQGRRPVRPILIAEGVGEVTPAALHRLRSLGVTHAQGFGLLPPFALSRPAPCLCLEELGEGISLAAGELTLASMSVVRSGAFERPRAQPQPLLPTG